MSRIPTLTPARAHEHYVGGEWVASEGTGTIDVIDSGTEEPIGTVAAGTPGDVDRAVAAARQAFPDWAAAPLQHRVELIEAVGGRIRERLEELSAILAAELGMPIELTREIQVGTAAVMFEAVGAHARDVEWVREDDNLIVVHEPVGVVGAITPWNFPLAQIAVKVAPALVAGCPVVLKPSEVTPLSALVLAELIDAVGFPPGVFNMVLGDGSVVGEALAGHPGIDMVSFTGSTRAGRRVSQLAGANVKPVALELGGKSANVILDDAPLEQAVAAGVENCYFNAGQTCSALTRMLVPRSRLAEVEDHAVAAAQAFVVGDPFDPESTMGPLVSSAQRERVRGYIAAGIADGARLLTGGADVPDGLDRGFFVRPTVFSSVRSEISIAQEEIFGPVLSILAYEDEADAVRIANDSRYGLAAGVWSADPERAQRVGRSIRAGYVQVNGGQDHPDAPFGGFKESGHGRENGPLGIAEFLAAKSLVS